MKSAINIFGIAALVALTAGYANWARGNRPVEPPPDDTRPFVPATEIPLLRLADAKALWRLPTTLFLDVRSRIDYDFGHIAGALSMPDDAEATLKELEPRLQKAETIVVYCGSRDCGKSLWAAIRLRQAGWTKTKIYPAGWNEWITNELPATVDSAR